MVNAPRWLTLATTTVVAALLVTACTPAAAPTAAPTPTAPPATATAVPPTDVPPTDVPPTDVPPTDVPPTDVPPTDVPPTEVPATPYPDPVEGASDPTTIADAYPNYGGEVDCDAGTFNGLPYTGSVKSITAPDPMTVVFTLCDPDVAFLSKMAFAVFAINDSDYLIEHALAGDIKDGMNGTGPFKLDEWRRGDSILYSRFDDYWGAPAATATGVLRWLEDPAARLQELQAETVHGYTLVGPDDFATVEGDAALALEKAPGLNTLYLGMNRNYAPWDNPAVRQALAIGIDRQRIVDNFMPDGSEVASHFTPCSIPFACLGDAWPGTDVAAARQMITDAVGEAGITTTLAYRNASRGYIPLPIDTATDFQAQLEAINIHVTLDEQESGTYLGNANQGLLTGLFLLGWGADYPDVTNFLDYHFGAGCTSAFGDCYPEVFDHLSDGATTGVEADREAAYIAANNAIREQVPMVPISHGAFANAYLAGVDHRQASPLSNELIFRMVPPDGGDQIVFLQNKEPIGLYCADETDGESLRACEQSMESLYGFEENGAATVPGLATSCDANADASEYTCHLREGVTFHNGASLEAKDVLVTFAAQWDALSAIHIGNLGVFEYWPGLWGGFLNPPGPCGLPNTTACPTE